MVTAFLVPRLYEKHASTEKKPCDTCLPQNVSPAPKARPSSKLETCTSVFKTVPEKFVPSAVVKIRTLVPVKQPSNICVLVPAPRTVMAVAHRRVGDTLFEKHM